MKRLRKSSTDLDPSIDFRIRKTRTEPIQKTSVHENTNIIKSICETLNIHSVLYWKLNEKNHSYSKQYATEVIDIIHLKLQSLFKVESTHVNIMETLKKRFIQSKNHTERLETTILVPKIFSKEQILDHLPGCSSQMVDTARKMLGKEMFFAERVPIERQSTEKWINIERKVKDFYYQDDVSRAFPGMKDTKSVKQKDGSRVHLAKRY